MPDTRTTRAVKNDEELSQLRAQAQAEATPEAEEEDVEVQSEDEQPVEEESATSEEESPDESETESDTESAEESEDEELTPEELELLSGKTKAQMTKLREDRRQLREELEALKKQKERQEVTKPLDEAKGSLVTDEEEPLTDDPKLPWEQSLTTQDVVRIAREEAEREKKISNIGKDSEYAEQKYPELNPELDQYDPDLSGEIYQEFRDLFVANDDYRLRDIVDRRMNRIYKAREQVAARKEAEAEVKKQEAEQAPPASVSPPKKKTSVSDLIGKAKTIEELEKLRSKI